jgi:hypothetical protein
MNPEVKTKWVAALRSGEFKQGTMRLRKDDCFCCLGVLCELFRAEKPDASKWEQNGDRMEFHASGVFSSALLPDPVWRWAGLDGRGPHLPKGDSLTFVNDNGTSFPEIAKLIEEQL